MLKWKNLKRIMGIAGALYIFCLIINGLNYIYVSPEDFEWERVLWHNFYEDKGKIDNLYLGSSHVFCGINPVLLDELNVRYNFNLASSAQSMNGTYFLLKEADRNNTLADVYVELYYYCSVKDNFNSNTDRIDTIPERNWANTDYMRPSFTKLQYMHSIADVEQYINICLPFSRYRAKLDDWEYIKQTISGKGQESYLNYEHHIDYGDGNGYEEYWRKGFFYCTRVFSDEQRTYPQKRILDEDPLGDKSEKYLRKTISYCIKRDIPIVLFVAPMDELELISTEHYDNYVNQIREIADEYGIEFYDFNLVKEKYLPIHNGDYFMDSMHLNVTGANMFTVFFDKIMSEDAAENSKYFYESYDEKLQDLPPAVYGLYYRDLITAEGKEAKNFHVASNREKDMEYRIVLTPNDGEQYMVQDFTENKEFFVNSTENGICTIVSRTRNNPDEVKTLEVYY